MAFFSSSTVVGVFQISPSQVSDSSESEPKPLRDRFGGAKKTQRLQCQR